LLAGVVFLATTAIHAGSAAGWQDMSGTKLEGGTPRAMVLSIAVKPGTDDSVLALTYDGTLWRWNAGISDWDSVWTAGCSLAEGSVFYNPLNPDSVFFSYVTSQALKPARGAEFGFVNTYLGSWSATGEAGWDSVAAEHFASVAVLSGSDTLIAAGSGGHIFASSDRGRTWSKYAGTDSTYVLGDIRKLLVVPGTNTDLVVAMGYLWNFGFNIAVREINAGGTWAALTDCTDTIGEVYDGLYHAEAGVIHFAANSLYMMTKSELVSRYEQGEMYIDVDPAPNGTYLYPRALAWDGSDLIAATAGYGARRVVNYGRGMGFDFSEDLPYYYATKLVAGRTKLFLSMTYDGAGGVYVADLTGGSRSTISGRIEINGAVPPVGSVVSAWVGSPMDHSEMYIAGQTTTDAAGNYAIEWLPAGTYTVGFLGPEGRIPYINTPGVLPAPFLDGTKIALDGANSVEGINLIFDGAPEWGVGRGELQSLAIPIAPGRTVNSVINSPDWIDYDWYYVPLDSSEGIIVDVEASPPGIFSPGIQFFDDQEIEIGRYGIPYGGTAAHIGAVAPNNKGLWFRVFNYYTWWNDKPADGSFEHRYKLTVSAAVTENPEPNSDVATATPLPEGTSIVGALGYIGEYNDWYKITTVGGALWVEANYLQGYLSFYVLDASGLPYGGYYGTTTSEAGTWRLDGVFPAGTYYVSLTGEYRGCYVIRRGGDPTEPNESPDTATPIAYGGSFKGMSIGSSSDYDAYVFTGTRGDIIAATVTPHDPEGEHPMIHLFSEDEEFYRRGVLQDNVEGLPNGKVRVVATLPTTGTYYLIVEPDFNWYNGSSPMWGAQALYDLSLELISEQVAGASDPQDLFFDPDADVFGPAMVRDEQDNTHYTWVDLSYGYGRPARNAGSAYCPYAGMVFYAKVGPDGTMLIAPSAVSPTMLYTGGEKPASGASSAGRAKAALDWAGEARPAIALDNQGMVHISWLIMGYAYDYALNIMHLTFDPAEAANDGGTLDESNVELHETIPIVDNIGDLPESYNSSWGEVAIRMLIGPDDVVHLVWEQEYAIRYARLTPNGNLIGEPITLASLRDGFNKAPDAVMDNRGRIHLVWNRLEATILYALINESGEFLIPPTAIGGDQPWAGVPTLALDPQGVVHVAWTVGTEPADYIRIRQGEVVYAQLRPDRAPLDGSPVPGTRITSVLPHVVTPQDEWPSIHPRLTVGEDGGLYLSWHQWGRGSEYPYMDGVGKPANGYWSNYDGPEAMGIEIAKLTSEGLLAGDPAIADAQVLWTNWMSDPSPVLVDADGVAHLAWMTDYREEYIEGYYYDFNTVRTQDIPVGWLSEETLVLVGYKPGLYQQNCAVPGDTLRFAILARHLSGPVDAASVYIKFDPTIVKPTKLGEVWTFLVYSALGQGENVEFNVEGDTLSVDAAAQSGVVISDTLFIIKMVVQPGVPLLTQSPLMFVNDPVRNRRTLINESPPSVMGAVLTVGIMGDVSVDGRITANDASIILQDLVGLTSIGVHPGLVEGISDVSGRAGLTAYDAALILEYVVGFITHFPAEGTEGMPRPAADAGLTYVAGFGRPRMDGDLFVLPISVDHRTGIQAGQVRFHMPASLGTIASVRTVGGGMATYRQEGDFVVVAFAGPRVGSPDAGDVLEVRLRTTNADLAQTISLTSVIFNEGGGVVNLNNTETNLLNALPQAAELGPNAPNPFNPTTAIPYAVPYSAEAGLQVVQTTLAIYSVTGQLVTTLVEEPMMPGRYRATWSGTDEFGRPVGAGVYIAVLRAGGVMKTTRMVFLR